MAVPQSVRKALAAKGDRKTDFERLKTALNRQEPDYVPLFEMGIDPEIKQQFMGRPLKGHAEEIEFFRLAGFDVYPVSVSVINVNMRPVEGTERDAGKTTGVGVSSHTTRGYKAELEAYTERHWAEMHKGVITTKEEFEAYPWPDPGNLDFSVLDEVGALLPPGMKIAVVIGKVFTGVWFMMGMETFMFAYVDDPELIEMMYGKIIPLQQRVMEAAMEHPAVGLSFHADRSLGDQRPLGPPRPLPQIRVPLLQADVRHGQGRGQAFHLPLGRQYLDGD